MRMKKNLIIHAEFDYLMNKYNLTRSQASSLHRRALLRGIPYTEVTLVASRLINNSRVPRTELPAVVEKQEQLDLMHDRLTIYEFVNGRWIYSSKDAFKERCGQ